MGQTEDLISGPLGRKADDIIYNIILLKFADPTNSFLPFMYAHSLELSVKTACLKLGIDFSKDNHNLMNIYNKIQRDIPSIGNLIPTQQHFTEYKKIWVKTEPILTKNINILDPKEKQPNLDEILQLELAYFIDNVMNLKYGVDKKNSYVSVIQISYEGLNRHFINLFVECRKIYANDNIDREFTTKFFNTFEKTKENQAFLANYLQRTK